MSAANSSYLALLSFVKVRPSIKKGSGNQPASLMVIGRWTNLNAVVGLQKEPTVKLGGIIVRIGNELGPTFWILVGSFF